MARGPRGSHDTISTPQPVQTEQETLALTGERTVPGIAEENYWFRRHEVAYEYILERCRDRVVLEAGSGEGYGANLISTVATAVTCVDYDLSAVEHTRARYSHLTIHQANLIDLPLPDSSIDTVVNFQVIEHLWDQQAFISECLRVLRPGGELLISTPNRITFSPGRDTPLNPFHTRELSGVELAALVSDAGFTDVEVLGLHHAGALPAMDARHGGSIVDAQVSVALSGSPWPAGLLADVEAVTCDDFALRAADVDASLDLLVLARRP